LLHSLPPSLARRTAVQPACWRTHEEKLAPFLMEIDIQRGAVTAPGGARRDRRRVRCRGGGARQQHRRQEGAAAAVGSSSRTARRGAGVGTGAAAVTAPGRRATAAPVAVLAPLLLVLKEPRRGASESHLSVGQHGAAWSVVKIPTLWWITASGAIINFNLYALGTFLPAFLTRVHGLTVAQSGLWLGVGSMLAGFLAAAIGGVMGDWAIRWRKDGRMLAASGAALAAAPLAFWSVMQPAGSWIAATVLMCAAYGLLNTYYGTVYSSIHDIVAPAHRGTAMSIYFMAMYLCGASFGPVITGRLSDMMARRAATMAGSSVITDAARATGLQQAMLVIPALSLGLALVLFAGSRTVAGDMAARDRQLQRPS